MLGITYYDKDSRITPESLRGLANSKYQHSNILECSSPSLDFNYIKNSDLMLKENLYCSFYFPQGCIRDLTFRFQHRRRNILGVKMCPKPQEHWLVTKFIYSLLFHQLNEFLLWVWASTRATCTFFCLVPSETGWFLSPGSFCIAVTSGLREAQRTWWVFSVSRNKLRKLQVKTHTSLIPAFG